MWSWIQDNASALSAVSGLVTVALWFFYAQLLTHSFRRQRVARVLINQCYGDDCASVCLVSNMSHEPVYIQCLVLALNTGEARYTSSITDLDRAESARGMDDSGTSVTRQGPLLSGHAMRIGRFDSLIDKAARDHGLIDPDRTILQTQDLQSVDVTAIINYGPDARALGFARRFLIRRDDNEALRVRPETVATSRLTNRRSRQRMQYWLAQMT
ncbi:hypothetical protein [Salinisphaera sp. Q1T1-3]|uniref:hypothetical protein n=1 Tax=Salinisphaera sp. Q1T1-3 TaxID=2321229 RepID=UPI000E7549BE|nr:hypothetical protein [Salinisphaera sp. Q1T1-3]RJS92340.1 hypothetical protein D3260_11880 [Salinisphaera sp. Q1T1-3]